MVNMKKKQIIIGVLAVLAIPVLMWLYGLIGTACGAFKPIEIAQMNAISKCGATLVLSESDQQQVKLCEGFVR